MQGKPGEMGHQMSRFTKLVRRALVIKIAGSRNCRFVLVVSSFMKCISRCFICKHYHFGQYQRSKPKVNTAPERVAIGQTSHITIYNTKNIKIYYYVNHGHERPDSDALGMLDGLAQGL